jgi:hypothetical protein
VVAAGVLTTGDEATASGVVDVAGVAGVVDVAEAAGVVLADSPVVALPALPVVVSALPVPVDAALVELCDADVPVESVVVLVVLVVPEALEALDALVAPRDVFAFVADCASPPLLPPPPPPPHAARIRLSKSAPMTRGWGYRIVMLNTHY